MINLLINLSIMFCDIKGEVKNPGVYEISNNNIYDVISAAGGLTNLADVSNINLSKKVLDEMVIYIPSRKEKPKECPVCVCPEPLSCPNDFEKETTTLMPTTTIRELPTTTEIKNNLININTASKEELIKINGIGEVTADKIIIYRSNNPFILLEDIMKVSGIGESLFAKIKNYITI